MALQLSIVIVSYNTRDLLASCLRSLERVRDEVEFEVIVVDNASPDETVLAIREHFKWVNIIRNTKNVGFAAALNIGVEAACSAWIFSLNPDTVVPRGSLAQLNEIADSAPKAGALGCQLIGIWGEEQSSAFRFPSLFREFLNLVPELKSPLARVASGIKSFISYTITLKKRTQITKFRAVEAVSGAAVLFRKAVWTAIGQFDPDFFLYHEEIDFCTRVRKAGFEVSLTPVPIIHFDGQASGYRTGRLPQMPVLEWRILGMNRLWAKHRPGLAHSLWRWMAIALFTMRLGLLKFGAFSGLKDGKYVANRVSDLRKLCGKIAQSVS